MSRPLSPRSLQLDHEANRVMEAAFEAAWKARASSGKKLSAQQACDDRIRIARVILDRVQEGERDWVRLQDLALASLDLPEEDYLRSTPTGAYL